MREILQYLYVMLIFDFETYVDLFNYSQVWLVIRGWEKLEQIRI